jgi:hypothetical protein
MLFLGRGGGVDRVHSDVQEKNRQITIEKFPAVIKRSNSYLHLD